MIELKMRKIELMHKMFGIADGTCKECINFKPANGGYSKCRIYGKSHSEATDWNRNYPACGKKNKTYHGGAVVKLVRPNYPKAEDFEGQIRIFDIEEALNKRVKDGET